MTVPALFNIQLKPANVEPSKTYFILCFQTHGTVLILTLHRLNVVAPVDTGCGDLFKQKVTQ